MAVFDDSAFDDHERVIFCRDAATGLKAIIAIHSTALGPAAGPQSQMAQNLVLSWLGGCRIMELKTVQIMDELKTIFASS